MLVVTILCGFSPETSQGKLTRLSQKSVCLSVVSRILSVCTDPPFFRTTKTGWQRDQNQSQPSASFNSCSYFSCAFLSLRPAKTSALLPTAPATELLQPGVKDGEIKLVESDGHTYAHQVSTLVFFSTSRLLQIFLVDLLYSGQTVTGLN